MAAAAKLLGQELLGTSDTTIIDVPTAKLHVVSTIFVANSDTTARTFRIFHVVFPDSATVANSLFYDITVPANSTVSLLEGIDRLVLSATDKLVGLASTASVVTVTCYGIEEDA
jgi:hypothetical protein